MSLLAVIHVQLLEEKKEVVERMALALLDKEVLGTGGLRLGCVSCSCDCDVALAGLSGRWLVVVAALWIRCASGHV